MARKIFSTNRTADVWKAQLPGYDGNQWTIDINEDTSRTLDKKTTLFLGDDGSKCYWSVSDNCVIHYTKNQISEMEWTEENFPLSEEKTLSIASTSMSRTKTDQFKLEHLVNPFYDNVDGANTEPMLVRAKSVGYSFANTFVITEFTPSV